MGHGSSRAGGDGGAASDDISDGGSRPSRFTRFRRHLHLHRHHHRPDYDSSILKSVSAEDFAGIAHIEIISAEMQYKGRWFACLPIGERTYRTATSADHTDKPNWTSAKKVVVDRNGPHIARLSVFETHIMSKSVLVGYCEVDLLEILSQVAFIAVGATMVGSITFTKKEGDYVHKGDEFGYFSFGGSTVICVFDKDAIQIDNDLLENSQRSLETLVSVGMRLGISKRSKELEEIPRVEDLNLDGKY